MKIMLIYPPIWESVGFRINCNNGMGLLYIGAVLREKGNEVRIVDAEVMGWTKDKTIEELKKWNPTHIGISCLSNGMNSTIELVKKIKTELPSVWVALGGPGPSAEPDIALSSGCDSVTIGEAELILDKSFGEKGIHMGIPPQDLDSLPLPAYDLLEPAIGSSLWGGNLPLPPLSYRPTEVVVMWSRGCIHPCTFCSKASMKRGKPRNRSPDKIVEELKILVKKFDVNSVFVYDDELIGMNIEQNKWLHEVVKKIDKELHGKIMFKGQGRCNYNIIRDALDRELLLNMKDAGFFAMMMGCESGSEKVKEHLKKGTSNDDIRYTLKTLHDVGIKVFGFWMIGMPEETREEAKKTEELIVEMIPYMEWIQVSVFSPLIGSDFWAEATENGWIKNFDKTKNIQIEPMLDMPWMNGNEILKWQKKFYTIFNNIKKVDNE